MTKEDDFKPCCVQQIKELWEIAGGSLNVVHYAGRCKQCNQFIGITQTSKEEADKFLIAHGISEQKDHSIG